MSPNITPALVPPYYAVIFTSVRTDDDAGYAAMAEAMGRLAAEQPGFLGVDSVRNPDTGVGITVAYRRDEQSVTRWRENMRHQVARRLGREHWYESFTVHVARVKRSYDFRRHETVAN